MYSFIVNNQTKNCTHFHINQYNLLICYTIKPVVGSRFSNRAHYNEFVESGFGSWALIRRQLVLRGEKRTGSDGPKSQGEGTPRLRTRILSSSRIPGASLLFTEPPSFCEISVVIYPSPPFIFFLHLSVIHAHTRVHVPSATFSGAL